MVDRRLNVITSRKLLLINALDRRLSHPIIGKNSHIPFSN